MPTSGAWSATYMNKPLLDGLISSSFGKQRLKGLKQRPRLLAEQLAMQCALFHDLCDDCGRCGQCILSSESISHAHHSALISALGVSNVCHLTDLYRLALL